jgi:hypothetical protein
MNGNLKGKEQWIAKRNNAWSHRQPQKEWMQEAK